MKPEVRVTGRNAKEEPRPIDIRQRPGAVCDGEHEDRLPRPLLDRLQTRRPPSPAA